MPAPDFEAPDNVLEGAAKGIDPRATTSGTREAVVDLGIDTRRRRCGLASRRLLDYRGRRSKECKSNSRRPARQGTALTRSPSRSVRRPLRLSGGGRREGAARRRRRKLEGRREDKEDWGEYRIATTRAEHWSKQGNGHRSNATARLLAAPARRADEVVCGGGA